jgi:hypothetical protein
MDSILSGNYSEIFLDLLFLFCTCLNRLSLSFWNESIIRNLAVTSNLQYFKIKYTSDFEHGRY